MKGNGKSEHIDVVAVGIVLRQLMAEFDRAAYAIHGSFASVDPGMEVAAANLRPVVVRAADAVYRFLLALEATPLYRRAREETRP